MITPPLFQTPVLLNKKGGNVGKRDQSKKHTLSRAKETHFGPATRTKEMYPDPKTSAKGTHFVPGIRVSERNVPWP